MRSRTVFSLATLTGLGGNRVVCGAAQRCLVSIADAAQPPQEQAAALIGFAH
jgi:hypothetical protein